MVEKAETFGFLKIRSYKIRFSPAKKRNYCISERDEYPVFNGI